MNKAPHILHVSAIGFTAEKFLLPQADDQRARGARVGFVFSPGPEAERLRARGFEVHEVPIPRGLAPLVALKSVLKQRKLYQALQPDIVHTHTTMGGLTGRVAAWQAGVPYVVHTVHGFPFIPGMPIPQYWSYVATEFALAKITTAMFSQSGEDVMLASRLGILPRTGEVWHIGNGVSLERFDGVTDIARRTSTRLALGIRPEQTLVSIIGRVNSEKGYPETIQALAGLPNLDWHLIAIGFDEGFQGCYQQLAEQKGCGDRISWLGLRPDVPELLEASDLFVLASHREGVPRSLIEAQAQGVPSIATSIRGCREVLLHGQTGLLVSPKDELALREAVVDLLGDPERCTRFAAAGQQRMREHFDEKGVCQRIWQGYEKLGAVQSNALMPEVACSL
jgi:glycosyltransferase involved in cell wall biosynthesis